MRVLQVLPSIASESGGPPRSTLASCRALRTADPRVGITLAATAQQRNSEWIREYESRMPEGMKLELFPAVGRHAFTYSLPLVAWLWRHVEDYDLVVVRALLHPISSTAAWIARRRSVPYIVVPHGTLSHYTFSYRRTLMKRIYFRTVEKQTLAGSAAVRFTSEAERREAPPWGADTPVNVIPHPYQPSFEDIQPGGANIQQILFLSRLHPVKGIDTLLEAVRIVLGDMPAARIVLAGSGTASYERHVRSEVRRLELEEAVDLPGFVEGEKKFRLLTESTVFVLPSHQENFGMAVVEAMDAGLPVVISRGVDIWPWVEQAGAGIVVAERTPHAVAEALVRLLRDDSLRRESRNNARELIRTAFDPTTIGRRLRELYRAAAEDRGRLARAAM